MKMNRSAAVFLSNISPCLVKVSANGCHILVSLTPRRTFNFTRNSDSFVVINVPFCHDWNANNSLCRG